MEKKSKFEINAVPAYHQKAAARFIDLGRRKEKELGFCEGALFSTVVFSSSLGKNIGGYYIWQDHLIAIHRNCLHFYKEFTLGVFLHELAHGLDHVRGTRKNSTMHGPSFQECCTILGLDYKTGHIDPEITLKDYVPLSGGDICTAYMDRSETKPFSNLKISTACALSSCYAIGRYVNGKRHLRCFGTKETLENEIRIEAELEEAIERAYREETLTYFARKSFTNGFFDRLQWEIYKHEDESIFSQYESYNKGADYAERYLAEKKILL